MGVKRSVCGKQGFRRGIANQQAAALNIGGQLRQAVQLIRAEKFPADLYAVRAGTGDKRQYGGLPAKRFNMVIPVRGGNDNNLSGQPNTPDDNLMRCLLR